MRPIEWKPLGLEALRVAVVGALWLLVLGWRLVAPRWPLFLVLLAGVVAPLWIVGGIAERVFDEEGYPWDRAALEFVRDRRSAALDRAMLLITNSVSWWGVGLGSGVAIAVQAARRSPRGAVFVVLAVGGAWVANALAKLAFRRVRPDYWDVVQPEASYSFPSGHAMCSMAFALTVLVLAWQTDNLLRRMSLLHRLITSPPHSRWIRSQPSWTRFRGAGHQPYRSAPRRCTGTPRAVPCTPRPYR